MCLSHQHGLSEHEHIGDVQATTESDVRHFCPGLSPGSRLHDRDGQQNLHRRTLCPSRQPSRSRLIIIER